MTDSLPVYITVRLEQFGRRVLRARPIGPWKIQAVGASESEVLKRLRRRLSKAVLKTLPATFHKVHLPEKHEKWVTELELKPQERNASWQEPLLVDLQSFRWTLENGQALVLVPAVRCTLYGKADELHDDEVSAQAKVALNRMAQDRDLLELHDLFASRQYSFRRLVLKVPLQPESDEKSGRISERKKTSTLRSTASDLTTARLSRVYGQEERVLKLAEHFQGENPQSVLLVGPAGVGKTSLVHQLVRMRADLDLRGRKVWSTTGARIVSGMSGLGMWQERCSKMIREAFDTKAILHLGSLFELMEAGKIDGSPGVASMIRHAIGRRKLVAIAECTPEQLAIVEREDPLLVRSFVQFELTDPEPDWTKDVLRQAAQDLYSQDAFSEGAIEELVRLHTRFATYSALPATALRLMRTMTEHAANTETARAPQSAHDVARAFAKQSGLPRFLVDDSIALDLEQVRSQLSRNVIGQIEPVDLIVDLIATLKARLVRPGKPLASLMFIGPTGVGKTEMAKAIARLLYSDTKRMLRIDMSEYTSPWSVSKLIGKQGEGDGALTSPIREQPFSVVLLDEFEKADPNVFDLLLQVLGEGRLTDAQGRLADFRNAVVIMTSNLGAETFRDESVGFGDTSTSWSEHFQREVQRFVRPEFLGRIDRIVPFQALTRDVVRTIAHREIDLLQQRAGLKYSNSDLTVDASAVDALCELGYQPKYGARPLRRAIEENVTVLLADKLGELASQDANWHFEIGADHGKFLIDATKKTGPSDSTKDQQHEVFDAWQSLGAMARCARKSSLMRKLVNDMERNKRQAETTRQKLKHANQEAKRTGTHSRRAVRLKENLVRLDAEIEAARQLKKNMSEVVQKICQIQLQVNLAWHDGQALEFEPLQHQRQTHLSRLRQTVSEVVKGKSEDGDRVNLIVIGSGKRPLEILAGAYRKLAEFNRWKMDHFILRPYDPLLDPKSAEYRKRASERKQDLTQQQDRPDQRLKSLGSAINTVEPACDLFRYSAQKFSQHLSIASGFVIHLSGTGVASWFENEHGTYHFFDPEASGAKRRKRCRVLVTTERLTELILPRNWQETVSPPERDPRRTFRMDERMLTDALLGTTKSYPQGKETQALFDLLKEEHEASLWRAIGYHGVPKAATLSS